VNVDYIKNNEQQKDVKIYTHSETKNPDFYHMLIVREDMDNQQSVTYELSLFGIMFTLALVRYYYVGIDNIRHHILNVKSNKLGLFFKDITSNDYFDKIASNYHDKLPLIFGKWDLLKKELGSLFLYNNFDFMLYDKAFSINMNTSIWQGGNKEFCDNLRTLADKSFILLKVLFRKGRDVLESFYQKKLVDDNNESKLLVVYHKLYEIESVLKYLNDTSYPDGVEKKLRLLQKKVNTQSESRNQYLNAIEFIERVFSRELAFFFYLNLNNDAFTTTKSYFQTSERRESEVMAITDLLSVGQDIFSCGSPKDRLKRILQNDGDIKQQFYTWMQILINYQQETSEKMSKNFNIINVENR
jgi:hypothetical protein